MSRATLHLLGSPSLFDRTGGLIAGGPAQRHRIALLAMLVVASPNVVSRDRLIGMLWPDRDSTSARRLLNVAITVLRQAFGAGAILSVGDDLRFGAEELEADVQCFDRAIEAGRLEEAVELCQGIFLEGFFLDDAEEFDRWMETQRLRFARRYTDALTVLAERAMSAENFVNATAWWRALHHAEPSNTNVVLRLFDALESTGDVTGALAVEEAHAAYMRSELGIEPDVRVSHRGAALRNSLTEAKLDRTLPRVLAVKTPPETVPYTAPPKGLKRPAFAFAALAMLLVSGATAFFNRGAAKSGASAGNLVTAVLPIVALSPLSGELADQITDLLTLNLGQIDGLSFVRPDSARVHAAERVVPGAMPIARVFHASMVVSGKLSSTDKDLTATFTVVDSSGNLVGSGATSVTVPNDANAVATLVDRASVSLMRALWGRRWLVPEPRVASVTTTSQLAMHQFLMGEAAFRRLQYDSAAAALQSAVDIDSTFALAYFRLGEVNDYRVGQINVLDPLEHAERLIHRLPAREAAMLRMWIMHEHKRTTSYDSAVKLVQRYPGDPDAIFAQADIEFHTRVLRDTPLDSQYMLWERAIVADPLSLRPLSHVIELATSEDTPGRFDRYVTELNKRADAPPPVFFSTIRLMRWGSLLAARDSFARLVKAPPLHTNFGNLLQLAENAFTRHAFDGYDANSRDLLEWSDSYVTRTLAGTGRKVPANRNTQNGVTLGMGRMTRPADEFKHGNPFVPAVGTTQAGAFGYAPLDLILAADEKLAAQGGRSWRVALIRAELAIARNDTTTARRYLDSAIVLEKGPFQKGLADEATYAHAFDRAVNGWLMVIAGDTANGLNEMRAGVIDGGYGAAGNWNDAIIQKMNGLMASWPNTRKIGIARLRTSIGDVDAYWPFTRYQLAKALDANGDREEAIDQYRRFAMLWSNADPALLHYAQDANKRAAELAAKKQ